MSTSKVPAALSALVTAITAALPTWSVWDGAALATETSYCTVGYDPQEASADGGQAPSNLGFGTQSEAFDIRSVLATWSGDIGMSDVRAAAFAALDVIADALATDPTLAGAVASARLTTYSYLQEANAEAASATIRFTVHIEAWR